MAKTDRRGTGALAQSGDRPRPGAAVPWRREFRPTPLALLIGLGPGLAWGHAALVKSTPGQRAALTRAPERVRLWLNEPLEARFARVSVRDGQGRQVDQQDGLGAHERPGP